MGSRWACLVAVALFVPGASARADNAEIVKKLKERGAKFDYYTEPKGNNPEVMHSHKITDAELDLVVQLKSLRVVSLQGNKFITDDGLKRLVAMENLTELDIWGTKVTPAGLAHVAKMKKLDTLGCGLETLTDDMLRELIRLNLAHKLSLASGPKGRPTSPDDVDYLQLYQVHLTDEGLKLLAVFKNVRQIELSGPKWTGAGLKHLAPLKKLTSLSPSPMSDAALKALRAEGMIHTLHWANTGNDPRPRSEKEVTSFLFHSFGYHGVTGAGVRERADLPNLERLDLSQMQLGDSAMKDAATLKSLKRLDTDPRVTDEGVKALTDLKLHTLTFAQGSRLTDAGMKHVAQIKTLRSLSLWDTKVTNEGLKELKGLKLHTLKLKREKIDDETLRVLRDLDLLHAIGIGFKGKPPESRAEVRWINLYQTQVTDEGLKELVGFKNLQGVTGSEKTTKKALEALRKKLPDIDIDP